MIRNFKMQNKVWPFRGCINLSGINNGRFFIVAAFYFQAQLLEVML